MLSKKLSEIDASLKPKGSNAPPKTVEVLAKIVNVMRDLLKLARRHKIENKLYYGDGLNRIYRQLDGNRRRRWLEVAGDMAEGEAQWNGLITFLEKVTSLTARCNHHGQAVYLKSRAKRHQSTWFVILSCCQ